MDGDPRTLGESLTSNEGALTCRRGKRSMRRTFCGAALTVVVWSVCGQFPASTLHAQNLLGSYRAAANAYRDAAAKSPERRACYLQWAAYYDGVVAELETGRRPPPMPASDCSGRVASGGGVSTGAGLTGSAATAAPTSNAMTAFNTAMGQVNAIAQQYLAERAATRRQRSAATKQVIDTRSQWDSHRMDDFAADGKILKAVAESQYLMTKTEGARILAEAERRVPGGSGANSAQVERTAYEMLRGNRNFYAWNAFVERFPNGTLIEDARRETAAAEAAEIARIEALGKLDQAMYEVTTSVAERCVGTAFDAKKNESVSCSAYMNILFDGDVGSCEVLYEVRQRAAAKNYCRMERQDLYRFSMSDVATMAVSGASVSLQTSSPFSRTTMTSQIGHDCVPNFNVANSPATAVSMQFKSPSVAQQSYATLSDVANYCRAAYGRAPSNAATPAAAPSSTTPAPRPAAPVTAVAPPAASPVAPTPPAAAPVAAMAKPAGTAAAFAGNRWTGALSGAYTYSTGASRPIDAAFAATLQPAGTGSATFDGKPQTITWTQSGEEITIKSSLKDYGCPGTLTIFATTNGTSLNGVFTINGPTCADASGTWSARRGGETSVRATETGVRPDEIRPEPAASRGSLAATRWSGTFQDLNRRNEVKFTWSISLHFAANGIGEASYFDGKKKLKWEQNGNTVTVKIDGPRGYNPRLTGTLNGDKIEGIWSDPFYGGNSRWSVTRAK